MNDDIPTVPVPLEGEPRRVRIPCKHLVPDDPSYWIEVQLRPLDQTDIDRARREGREEEKREQREEARRAAIDIYGFLIAAMLIVSVACLVASLVAP